MMEQSTSTEIFRRNRKPGHFGEDQPPSVFPRKGKDQPPSVFPPKENETSSRSETSELQQKVEERLQVLSQVLMEGQEARLEALRGEAMVEHERNLDHLAQISELHDQHLGDFEEYPALGKAETYEAVRLKNAKREQLMPTLMAIWKALDALDTPKSLEMLHEEEKAVCQHFDRVACCLQELREGMMEKFRQSEEELRILTQARLAKVESLMPALQRFGDVVDCLAMEVKDETAAKSQLKEGRMTELRGQYALLVRANDIPGLVWAQAEADAAQQMMDAQLAECSQVEALLKRWTELSSCLPAAEKVREGGFGEDVEVTLGEVWKGMLGGEAPTDALLEEAPMDALLEEQRGPASVALTPQASGSLLSSLGNFARRGVKRLRTAMGGSDGED